MIDFFHKSAATPEKVTRGRITHIAQFLNEEDAVTSVLLEVADTPDARRRGLMGRDELPSICGMLFEGLSGGGYFWMKNCLIPLDIAFMNKDGFITKMYTMPVDKNGSKHYNYDENDVSAIEVPKGFLKKWGIARGFSVRVAKLSRKESANG